MLSEGTGITNLQYRMDGGVWQKSSTFEIKEMSGSRNILFEVKDSNGDIDSKSQSFTFNKLDISITTDNIRPNCGEAEGRVDATVTGGWRYLVFDNPEDYVDIPAQYITEQNQFTMEGDIKLDVDIDKLTGQTG